MSKPIQFGSVYRNPILNLHYVVVKYHNGYVPGTKLKDVYEVVKLHSPDDVTYAAVATVESWELVE